MLVPTTSSTGAAEMGAATSTLAAHACTQVSSRAAAAAAQLTAGGPDGAANPSGSSHSWRPFLLQQCLLAMLSAWGHVTLWDAVCPAASGWAAGRQPLLP